NVTSDVFAGVAADEIVDPRPLAELLRQWSTFHPEFSFLPRKFKIAVDGATEDRAAVAFHDIGLHAVRAADGGIALDVWVGGGMGRTPIVGHVIRRALPWQHMNTYVEAILRVYNRHGRRDNIYKARIKILVKALGVDAFAREVDAEFAHLEGGPDTLTQAAFDRVARAFADPPRVIASEEDAGHAAWVASDPAFARWVQRNVHPHRAPGWRAVTLSLKRTGVPPGDATAEQMECVAALADRHGFGEIRVSQEQNLVLPDVPLAALHDLWRTARAAGLATPNLGLLTDIVCCPGGDFCSLANARSIPIAEAIQRRFDDLDWLHDIGDLDLNISGCMNSCGWHHAGHIGILGVDKDGEEWYQVSIGGSDGSAIGGGRAAIGRVIGPSFRAEQMPDVIERLVGTYVDLREGDERFVDTVQRVGLAPFKARAYATDPAVDARVTQEAVHV
nr:nitrite/sulfite reductase [Burkholderiales bacterium]